MIHDTIQSQGENLPLVSVIIPVYNAQDYVALCIESVLNQTYQNFEVICVDDGSTDKSIEIIKRLVYRDSRFHFIQIENHGQGYARNLGLEKARGKYVMFLDSDDFIESITLDLAVTRAEEDESDFVVFDWRYYNPVAKASNYCNKDMFFSEKILEGEECLKLFQVASIFTVNKLYRHSFLEDKNVRYAEGYLYEDNPYWIKAVVLAAKVSLIHSPLYRVTISQTSSTKTNTNTDKHCKSFICAVSDSVDFLNEANERLNEAARYHLTKYFTEKFIYYYLKRTPREFQKAFLRQFVDVISRLDFQNQGNWKLLFWVTKLNVFKRKSYQAFTALLYTSSVYKPAIKKCIAKMKSRMKKISAKIIRSLQNFHLIRAKKKREGVWGKYNEYLKQPLYTDVILFMGFDFRYTGNSRYLFEEMLRKGSNKKLFFVTNNPLVPLQYRIKPNSDRCTRFIARSKVIVFESWIPLRYKKRTGATWVQLWHGTPLKCMLFDSNEKAVITRNPDQKVSKFKDISRWDYIIVDNPTIKSFFQTAFLFPPERMLESGYPRVKYLIEKKEDIVYKNILKAEYNIPMNKKVVLYLPTWRDCNYRIDQTSFDTAYILDAEQLKELLGEEYFIISKDHNFLSKLNDDQFLSFKSAETQELLLIADYLITDYSSVMFDAFAIELPVILYCTDFKKNEELRGVYREMWNKISYLCCETVEDVVAHITNYTFDIRYQEIREKYGYRDLLPQGLSTFIESI